MGRSISTVDPMEASTGLVAAGCEVGGAWIDGVSMFTDSAMSVSGDSGSVEVEFNVGAGGGLTRGLGIRRRRAVVVVLMGRKRARVRYRR